jgi:hypothetical protein
VNTQRHSLTRQTGCDAVWRSIVKPVTTLAAAAVALVLGCQDPAGPALPQLATDPAAATASSSPLPPSNASAVGVSQTQVNIGWQDNSLNESRFELYRSSTGVAGTFTLLATTGVNVIAFSDRGLEPGTQYCYRVRAVRSAGMTSFASAFSNTACATTFPSPPAAASDAYTVLLDSVGVALYWIDRSTNEDGFRIYRSIDGGAVWAIHVALGANANSWKGEDPLAEKGVCYRVVAFNAAAGEATPSNSACPTPPAQPTYLTVTPVDGGMLELAWNDNSAVEDNYEVWFLGWSPFCGAGACDAGVYGDPWVVAELPANSTTYRTAAQGCYETIACYFNVVATKTGAP